MEFEHSLGGFKDVISREWDEVLGSDFDEQSHDVQSVRSWKKFNNILRYDKGNIKDKSEFFIFKGAQSLKLSSNSNPKKKRDAPSSFKVSTFKVHKRNERSFSEEFEGTNNVSMSLPSNRADLRRLPSEMILEELLKSDWELRH